MAVRIVKTQSRLEHLKQIAGKEANILSFAVGLALATAIIHLYLGLTEISASGSSSILPLLFVGSAGLVFVGILALYRDIPRNWLYLLGILLMVAYITGYVGLHSFDSPGPAVITESIEHDYTHAHGHGHDTSQSTEASSTIFTRLAISLASDPFASVAFATEILLVILLSVLYRIDSTRCNAVPMIDDIGNGTVPCKYCTNLILARRYMRHLTTTHADQLTRVDRRFTEHISTNVRSPRPSIYILGVTIGVLGLLLIATATPAHDTSEMSIRQPYGYGTQHIHGEITLLINGQSVDFTEERFQNRDRYFRFEEKEGNRWHAHGQDVTLAYAMNTVGLDMTTDHVTLAHLVRIYDSDPDTSISIIANGKPVDPRTYALKDGDRIRIIIEVG